MTKKWTASLLVDRLTEEEQARAQVVEGVLPALREAAQEADLSGQFYLDHVRTLGEAGLLGLVVPEAYGGMGGGLRDLAGACFAMGTACASTALAYFFHCSTASRGLLGIEAIEAGLFNDQEARIVRAFAEKLLHKMGHERKWLANFASESTKTSKSAVTISTTATKTSGGWLLNGVKSFGCATDVADEYLVTAVLADNPTSDGLSLFFVPRDAQGVSVRSAWDAIGMRATANNGIVLKEVFVPDDEALALEGAFVRMMRVSRGSFVGNQMAATAIYVGAAQAVYDYALGYLTGVTFGDTGQPIAESPLHQQLIGEMTAELESAYLWMRRQLELETCEPPLLDKERVVQQWRMAKGSACEHAFQVAVLALKACGTSNTDNRGVIARGLRDLSMGLVQAFPAERGRLMAAEYAVKQQMQSDFSVIGAKS